MGYSLLTGSLTLTLMVLPLVTRNTQEALKTVPDSFRTGAVGLGAGNGTQSEQFFFRQQCLE